MRLEPLECTLLFDGGGRFRLCVINALTWGWFKIWPGCPSLLRTEDLPLQLTLCEHEALALELARIEREALPSRAIECHSELKRFLSQARRWKTGIELRRAPVLRSD